jgi:hypothetical protein
VNIVGGKILISISWFPDSFLVPLDKNPLTKQKEALFIRLGFAVLLFYLNQKSSLKKIYGIKGKELL